jgi:predicted methyltransferase
VRDGLHWTDCGMQWKRQIKIMISEFNFIIINIKVDDNYFNAGIIKLAVLLNLRDI